MNFFFNIISPLDQFEIRDLLNIHAPVIGNISLSITNISLYLTISAYILAMVSILSTNNNKLIPNG
jgi:F-type H+-transporting ATPase subunit a